jgi:aminoglycoside 6'-N-acetyltransferase I
LANRYGLQIRASDSADAPGVAELMQAAGMAVHSPAIALRLERLREQGAMVLLAVEWGPPSGLVVLHTRQTLEADPPVAIISTLLVAPDARRRGIGRLLLKAAAQAARTAGCADLHLATRPEDADTVAFCRATGFTEAGAVFVRPLRKRG